MGVCDWWKRNLCASFLKLTDNPNSAYFYDLNTKMSFPINDQNKLYLSGYFGRDVFNVDESFVNTYGNAVFNLRWNHLFSPRLFSNLSIIYSDYYYGLLLDFAGFDWNSGIQNLNFKYDFSYFANDKTNLEFGLQSTYYTFNPGFIEPARLDSGINAEQLQKKYAMNTPFMRYITRDFSLFSFHLECVSIILQDCHKTACLPIQWAVNTV